MAVFVKRERKINPEFDFYKEPGKVFSEIQGPTTHPGFRKGNYHYNI